MAINCPSISYTSVETSVFNVTEVLHQRWEDSPKDDRTRLEKCWGIQDCGDCHRSDGHCGWCAISSTCLPLPLDPLSKAFPLLSPIRHKFICALGPERFELRTSGLGCQVSTITFLTSLVTIFCTIGGLTLLYGLVKCIGWLRFFARAGKGGWTVYGENVERREEVWKRKAESWGRWWRKMTGRLREDERLVLDDGIEERSKWVWWSMFSQGRRATDQSERRPLLQ